MFVLNNNNNKSTVRTRLASFAPKHLRDRNDTNKQAVNKAVYAARAVAMTTTVLLVGVWTSDRI